MKYLKLFEGYKESEFAKTKDEVEDLCDHYIIDNWSINSEGLVDIDDNVSLYDDNLKKLPFKFRNVTGTFYCNNNKLESLEGSPIKVGGAFNCSVNQLTSLKWSPQSVGGSFLCNKNKLKSLEGSPQSVGGTFYCNDNKLKTLEGGPTTVGEGFICFKNKLESLKGSPQSVHGTFNCSSNQLKTLEGCPKSIMGYFECSGNPCTPLYKEWINTDRREELLDLMLDYDFLRDDIIIWDRLVSFYEDAGLNIPDKDKLEKYYKII